MSHPKFPNVEIDITGPKGNAYAIMGIVSQVLRQTGSTNEQVSNVLKDMMSSNYEHLVSVAARYVTIKNMDCLEGC